MPMMVVLLCSPPVGAVSSCSRRDRLLAVRTTQLYYILGSGKFATASFALHSRDRRRFSHERSLCIRDRTHTQTA